MVARHRAAGIVAVPWPGHPTVNRGRRVRADGTEGTEEEGCGCSEA